MRRSKKLAHVAQDVARQTQLVRFVSKLLTFALTCAFGFSAQFAEAKISLIDYSKYFYTMDTTDPAAPRLYAGASGKACAATSTSTTCDSCASLTSFATGAVCNTNQINPNLKFTVTIQSDSAEVVKSPNSVYVVVNGSTVVASDAVDAAQFKANSPILVSFTWGNLCKAINSGDSTCLSSFPATTLQVGIGSSSSSLTESVKLVVSYRYVPDGSSPLQTFTCTGATAYEGFCFHTVYPGDKKVFITGSVYADTSYTAMNLTSGLPSTTPTADSSGHLYSAMRVYYAPGNSYAALNGTSAFKDMKFTDGNFKESTISDLENGVQYVFLTASVDQGGNTTLFTNPADGNLCPATDASCYLPPYKSASGLLTQTVTPTAVQGLLDGQKCFVATAAYGSSMSKEVRYLRNFRDQVLLKHTLGKWFVRNYYKYSPPMAEWIAESEWRRQIVRALLWPAVGMARWWLGALESDS